MWEYNQRHALIESLKSAQNGVNESIYWLQARPLCASMGRKDFRFESLLQPVRLNYRKRQQPLRNVMTSECNISNASFHTATMRTYLLDTFFFHLLCHKSRRRYFRFGNRRVFVISTRFAGCIDAMSKLRRIMSCENNSTSLIN